MPPRTRKAVEPTAAEQLAAKLSKQLDELLAQQEQHRRDLDELTKAVNRLWVKVM